MCAVMTKSRLHASTKLIANQDLNLYVINYIRVNAYDFTTFGISEPPRLRQACASTKSRKCLYYSHAQGMGVVEDSDQVLNLLHH